VTQTRMVSVPKIVEYERPQIVQGKMIRTYDAGQQYAAASQAVVTGYGQTTVVGPYVAGSQAGSQAGSARPMQFYSVPAGYASGTGGFASVPFFANKTGTSAGPQGEGAQV